MNLYLFQVKARNEWMGSAALQRQYPTLEFYWWSRYLRIYCPSRRLAMALTVVSRRPSSWCRAIVAWTMRSRVSPKPRRHDVMGR